MSYTSEFRSTFSELRIKLMFIQLKMLLQHLWRKLLKDWRNCSQWWALNKSAISYICRYLSERPEVLSFYKYSHIPDEMFFQTILYGTGNEEMKESIFEFKNSWMTFTHWDRPSEFYGQPLTMSDYEAVAASEKLFARKFELNVSDELLVRLDMDLNSAC
jgi:hypothetical protein